MAVRAMDYAAAEHVDDLDHLAACLRADPQAAAFAPDVEAASAALRTQSEHWDRNRHLVQETQKGLAHASEVLCNDLRAAHAVILYDVGWNRHSSRFLTYFPRGLVAFTRAPHLDQLTSVRSLALRCAQDPNPRIREQAGLLQAAADRMDAAFARRAEAFVAEAASFGQLQVEKLAIIETSRRVGHRLVELYPYQRGRVRSYFRKIYRRPRPAVPAAGELTARESAAGKSATGELAARESAVHAAHAGPTLVPALAATSLQRTAFREVCSTSKDAGRDDLLLGADVRGDSVREDSMTLPALGLARWGGAFPGRRGVPSRGRIRDEDGLAERFARPGVFGDVGGWLGPG